MLISHEDHKNTIQVYSVIVLSHVIALKDGQSKRRPVEPITPVYIYIMFYCSAVMMNNGTP